MTTAAIYTRKSTETKDGRSKDALSTALQESRARAFADKQGWAIGTVYVDEAISGAEFKARPGFNALLADCTGPAKPDVVLLADLSRLGRDQVRTQSALRDILDEDVRVFTVLDGKEITMNTAIETFMHGVTGFGNEHQREAVKVKNRDASFAKFERGEATGRCYGYVTKDRARTIDPTQERVVLRIFEARAAGLGYQRIGKALVADGIPSPSGNAFWQPTAIASILANETYLGKLTWGAETRVLKKGHKVIVKNTERIEPKDKPEWRIVSDDLWARVQAVTKSQSAISGSRWRKPVTSALMQKHLILPITACATCHGPLYAKHDPRSVNRPHVLVCSKRHRAGGDTGCTNTMRVPAPWAETAILDAVERALAPRLLADMVTEALAEAEAKQEDPKALAREITKTRTEVDRLVTALAASDNMPEILAALTAKKAALATLQERAKVPATFAVDPAKLRAKIDKAMADWKAAFKADPARAAAELRGFFPERILVSKDPNGAGWLFEGLADAGAVVATHVGADLWSYLKAFPVSTNSNKSRACTLRFGVVVQGTIQERKAA